MIDEKILIERLEELKLRGTVKLRMSNKCMDYKGFFLLYG